MSRLIGVVTGPTLAAMREQIAKAVPYADLLEIRLDLLEPRALEKIKEIPRPKPCIFTFRKKSQGGARDLSEHERLQLFEQALAQEPEYCDIETDTELTFFDRIRSKHPNMHIIGSFHDLEKMPEHLDQVLEKMQKPQISFYKIAVVTPSTNDVLQLLVFTQEHQKVTCIGLGPEGSFSRILAPVVGADFCYSSIEDISNGLGQISLKTLCDVYHFKQKNRKTKIYALLGDPIEKSIGHLFHNKLFGKDAIYVKLRVAIPELTRFFSLMRKLPFHGFSVTMPLKEQLSRYLTQIDAAATAIGSVNTIKIEDEHLVGYNTDGEAVKTVLMKNMKSLRDCKVVVFGAGGTARAIAYALMKEGASVCAINRSFERAEALAKAFGCRAGRWENLKEEQADVLINTVPADLIFPPELFSPAQVVLDLIYWEEETSFLKVAKQKGATCINGLGVFEEQARRQQAIWKEKKTPEL
jgi:3-dehydroquinate dehydratase / shikimate dehydrogenase